MQKLEPLLRAGGDVGRGRRIFFGEKVACSSCHTIGTEGGHVGPDLTGIGAIRSGHDLLEAVVFPSASFVPGHEVYNVETANERIAGVIRSRIGGRGGAGNRTEWRSADSAQGDQIDEAFDGIANAGRLRRDADEDGAYGSARVFAGGEDAAANGGRAIDVFL